MQPAQTGGYLLAEQAASLRAVSHDAPFYGSAAAQSGVGDRQPFSIEDEEMHAAFGRKLSLTDSYCSAQEKLGENQGLFNPNFLRGALPPLSCIVPQVGSGTISHIAYEAFATPSNPGSHNYCMDLAVS